MQTYNHAAWLAELKKAIKAVLFNGAGYRWPCMHQRMVNVTSVAQRAPGALDGNQRLAVSGERSAGAQGRAGSSMDRFYYHCTLEHLTPMAMSSKTSLPVSPLPAPNTTCSCREGGKGEGKARGGRVQGSMGVAGEHGCRGAWGAAALPHCCHRARQHRASAASSRPAHRTL